MSKTRPYSKYAKEAARLLGQQIKIRRKQRRWSEQELSKRAGIARATLQKIEKGDPTSTIGLVFEVTTLVGFSCLMRTVTILQISAWKRMHDPRR